MITFILPIFKQEHILEKSVMLLNKYLSERLDEKYEILICNDGSPDGCPEIAKFLAGTNCNIFYIGYSRNRGRGYAIKYASLKARGEYIICMDCDLIVEKYLHYIDQMIKDVKCNDIVIASRFHSDANTERKFIREFMSKAYRLLIKIIFPGFKVTDPDVGFKGFQKNVFECVNLVTNLNGPSWDLQFLVNAESLGYKIYEFPFSYKEDYSRTTVNIITCSIVELVGLLYIKLTCLISRNINF